MSCSGSTRAELKQERATALGAQDPAEQQPLPTPVTNHAAQAAKVALFRSLFRGRAEVYARRFESLKTGKTGYQPVCRNEWFAGICEKPKTRCDDRLRIPCVLACHLDSPYKGYKIASARIRND